VSVFGGDEQVPADDDAVALWRAHDLPPERIVPLGRKDNFWGPAGATGPCGPCSELYFDMGEAVGCGRADCAPGCDCDRFMEFYNLVFVQYDMGVGGELTPLPRPSIDTGLGLERMAAITQGTPTVYESDVFKPLIELGAELSSVKYESFPASTRALRTIAEHARGVAFLVADGVLPGNEGRDYVLRRIIRRAVQQGVSIGMQAPFVATMSLKVVDLLGSAYPELVASRAAIAAIAGDEEQRFRRTLDQGIGILDEAVRRAQAAGVDLPAEVAFELHDTYGFPFDLTREIVRERELAVDEEGFARLMSAQRSRARAAQRGGEWGEAPGEAESFQREHADLPSTFVGYERLEVFTVVRAVRVLDDGRVLIKLAETPFYAEGGGQSADGGWVHTESGKLDVEDVVRFENDQVIIASVAEGSVTSGQRAKAMVNAVRRHQTACNHTATHLLHNALRIVLGEGVRQAGSAVRAEKLRFDYTTRQAPSVAQLQQIEELANRRIVENHPVRPYVTTREYAAEIGAIAFFEEKYGDFVRVLEIDDFSRELCGGTHVSSTAQIGMLKITASSSVGANTRRLEAITSARAAEYFHGLEATLREVGEALSVPPDRVAAAVHKQAEQLKALKRGTQALAGDGLEKLDEVMATAQSVGGAHVVAAAVEGVGADDLLQLADQVRERLGDVVAILATSTDARVAVVVAVSDSLTGRGLHAQEILRTIMPEIDGKGGGKPVLARGGGSKVEGIAAGLAAGAAKARELLGA
jgi:alanyl-tRNA synthetase